jgi:hypothetical protein
MSSQPTRSKTDLLRLQHCISNSNMHVTQLEKYMNTTYPARFIRRCDSYVLNYNDSDPYAE